MKIKSFIFWWRIIYLGISAFFAYFMTRAADYSYRSDIYYTGEKYDIVYIIITFLIWFLLAVLLFYIIEKVMKIFFAIFSFVLYSFFAFLRRKKYMEHSMTLVKKH
jgi:uncharacterized protein HemY